MKKSLQAYTLISLFLVYVVGSNVLVHHASGDSTLSHSTISFNQSYTPVTQSPIIPDGSTPLELRTATSSGNHSKIIGNIDERQKEQQNATELSVTNQKKINGSADLVLLSLLALLFLGVLTLFIKIIIKEYKIRN